MIYFWAFPGARHEYIYRQVSRHIPLISSFHPRGEEKRGRGGSERNMQSRFYRYTPTLHTKLIQCGFSGMLMKLNRAEFAVLSHHCSKKILNYESKGNLSCTEGPLGIPCLGQMGQTRTFPQLDSFFPNFCRDQERRSE